MKRSIVLALLIGTGIFVGSAVIPQAIADCGTCEASDAPEKKEACPACEKMKDGKKCPKCEAKKKKDEHGHDH